MHARSNPHALNVFISCQCGSVDSYASLMCICIALKWKQDDHPTVGRSSFIPWVHSYNVVLHLVSSFSPLIKWPSQSRLPLLNANESLALDHFRMLVLWMSYWLTLVTERCSTCVTTSRAPLQWFLFYFHYAWPMFR